MLRMVIFARGMQSQARQMLTIRQLTLTKNKKHRPILGYSVSIVTAGVSGVTEYSDPPVKSWHRL